MAANDPLTPNRGRSLTPEEAEQLAAQIRPSWEFDALEGDSPAGDPLPIPALATSPSSRPFSATDTIIEGVPTVSINGDGSMSAPPPEPAVEASRPASVHPRP